MNITKIAVAAGLAGTLTGCVVYDDGHGIGVAPLPPAPVMAAPVVSPVPVVAPAPAVVVPAYRPFWWGPHHHHYHGRWR